MAHRSDSLVIRTRVEDRKQVQKDMFVTVLENVHTVTVAARLCGLSTDTIYRWRKEDNDFAAKWDHAILFSTEVLETALYHKLAKEVTNPKALSMPTERLAEFMLTGMKPEKYKQRGFNQEINVNQLNVSIDWSKIPDDMVNRFNAGEITLQDVYEYWALQSKEQARSDPSED